MRLLALDIDKTLTGHGRFITEPNLEAIKEAMAAGIKVTLITGRRYTHSASLHADALGLRGPVGCHYGRRIVDHPSGEVLSTHPLPEGAPKALVEAARPFPGAFISVFIGDDLVFEKLPAGIETVGVAQFRKGDMDRTLAESAGEMLSILVSDTPGRGALEAVGEAGERLYPGLLDYYYSPSWSGEESGLLTVLSTTGDKGTALIEIARRLGVDPADTVAMGDSAADIPMLRAAGVGVAVPWAGEDVLRAADLVAEGEPDDAAARAIRALLR